MPVTKQRSRLDVLDYLRGFFIVVIIIDHLSRWPSAFSLFTGQAWLWITAAEGFVIISGLLIGYVRGYKSKELPFATVTKKLLLRALLLYAWSIIATIVYTAVIWYVPLQGGAQTLPMDVGDWPGLILQTVTLTYTNVWVHFLALYAIFLAASPVAVWLLRRGQASFVIMISLLLLGLGWQLQSEVLQWQALFFIPSVAGYYLPSIKIRWQALAVKTRRTLVASIMAFTSLTIMLSVITTFHAQLVPELADSLNAAFPKETISLWRLVLALIWFGGFLLLFIAARPWIKKWLGWLLMPIGSRSLTAYILHGLALCIISFLTVRGDNIFINTLLGAAAVLIVWGLVRIPFVQKIIPR